MQVATSGRVAFPPVCAPVWQSVQATPFSTCLLWLNAIGCTVFLPAFGGGAVAAGAAARGEDVATGGRRAARLEVVVGVQIRNQVGHLLAFKDGTRDTARLHFAHHLRRVVPHEPGELDDAARHWASG